MDGRSVWKEPPRMKPTATPAPPPDILISATRLENGWRFAAQSSNASAAPVTGHVTADSRIGRGIGGIEALLRAASK